ncbi:pyrokinin-1 receptor-like [Dreissena polymorpha]|nr:pyrokinin-1 receptor-like [Dreissena polymorpha]
MEYFVHSYNGSNPGAGLINVSLQLNTDEHILEEKLGPKQRELVVVIVLLCVYCLIFMTGITGNIVTCVVILKTSYMRTSTNYYLFSLAISDVMLLIVGLPPEAYSIWESYPWRFGKPFCIIKALISEMTSYASVLTITAFTIERYIAICKPLVSHKIVAFSRCVKIIVTIWIISFCCALPYPIHTDLFYYVHNSHGDPISDSLQCNIPPMYYRRMTHVFQMSSFVFFLVPLTVIIVLYVLIGLTLRRAEMRREASEKYHHPHPRSGSQGSKIQHELAVVVAFFVCWAPFHAQRLLTVYNTDWTPDMLAIQSSLFYVSGVLYFIGSTVNPILYNVMSRRYRLAFLETICKTKPVRTYNSKRPTNGNKTTKFSMKDNVRSPVEADFGDAPFFTNGIIEHDCDHHESSDIVECFDPQEAIDHKRDHIIRKPYYDIPKASQSSPNEKSKCVSIHKHIHNDNDCINRNGQVVVQKINSHYVFQLFHQRCERHGSDV